MKTFAYNNPWRLEVLSFMNVIFDRTTLLGLESDSITVDVRNNIEFSKLRCYDLKKKKTD